MTTSIWRLLATAFFKTQGPLIGALGLVLAVLTWVIPLDAKATVSVLTVVRWTAVPALIGILLLATLLRAILVARTLTQLPRVLHARAVALGPDGSSGILLLLDRSELFGHDAVVSVYHVDSSDFEELVGVGHVRNIQEDGKIQILLGERVTAASHDTVNKLALNDAAVLARVKVKPSAPHGYMS
jgi:hypothetical protein